MKIFLAAGQFALVLLLAACGGGGGGGVSTTPRDEVIEVPVRFAVTNMNRSQVMCATDGLPYEIRGHLVGPRSKLDSATPQNVALYLHGIGWGAFYWRFKSVPGYDYVAEMARLGHVSVVFDQLGYGAPDSGRPAGTMSCYGGEADIASQIVGQLKTGAYTATGRSAPRFAKVALGSHVTGGLMTEPEAISFMDVDALVITSWADSGFSSEILAENVAINMLCASGGEPSEGTSGSPGYHHTPLGEAQFRSIYFFDADPSVVNAAVLLRQRGPCGEAQSAVAALAVDNGMANTVTVPVLLVLGDQDGFFTDPASAGQTQMGLFSGSMDKTLTILPGAGSALTLERSAPAFRSTVSTWLKARGF